MSKQDTIISLLKKINENVDNLDTTFVTTDLAITENGSYKPIDYDVEGFNIVDVNVSPTLEEITITENGEYIPSEGVDGFSKVVVEAGSSNKVVLPSDFKVRDYMVVDGYWAAELVDTSYIINMNSLFSVPSLQQLDVSDLDTSNAVNMQYMFQGCTLIKELNVSKWDVSNVINMKGIFQSCSSLQQLDVSNWNISNATDITDMFVNCSSLQQLDVSNWNISNKGNLGSIFENCKLIKELNVSKWDVSNITNLNATFSGCRSLQYLDLSKWDASNVIYISFMCDDCSSLTSIIGNRAIEDVLANAVCALNGLKVGQNAMFTGCNNLDRASLRALINGLADITGQTTQTLTIGTTLIAKLTEEDIAIATAKNWTIA